MTNSGRPAVAICMVTYNSSADLPSCFESLAALEHRPLELVVVDCASHDDSAGLARRLAPRHIPTQVVELGNNVGFAGGMNEAFRLARARFLLTLNADARPRPDYLEPLLSHFQADGLKVGAATGRLVRTGGEGERKLDACGMYLTRNWRHLDRGSGELDRGQWSEPERVFGATGAASLFAREALVDVSQGSEIFDPTFHSFREDAELCFRLQERGWEVIFDPRASAEHRRNNLPSRRRLMPAAVNYHSLKNRYLLRAYHQTARNLLRTAGPATLRDLMAFSYVLFFERSSLSAYLWLWRHRRQIRQRRRWIQQRRTVPEEAIERWFTHRGLPLPAIADTAQRARPLTSPPGTT